MVLCRREKTIGISTTEVRALGMSLCNWIPVGKPCFIANLSTPPEKLQGG